MRHVTRVRLPLTKWVTRLPLCDGSIPVLLCGGKAKALAAVVCCCCTRAGPVADVGGILKMLPRKRWYEAELVRVQRTE